MVAAERGDQLVLAPDVGASAARGLERARLEDLLTERRRLVVHDPREGSDVELRPRHPRGRALADLKGHAAALDLDRLEIRRAERLGDALERRATVLGLSGDREEQQNCRQKGDEGTHRDLLARVWVRPPFLGGETLHRRAGPVESRWRRWKALGGFRGGALGAI